MIRPRRFGHPDPRNGRGNLIYDLTNDPRVRPRSPVGNTNPIAPVSLFGYAYANKGESFDCAN